jgi:predicted SAM-dependent methyltransferase
LTRVFSQFFHRTAARLRNARRLDCPVCACTTPRKFTSIGARTLLQCPDCRHIYWSRFPTAAELDHYYQHVYTEARSQATLQEGNREYYRRHVEELLYVAGNPDPDGVTLVDFGCSIPVMLQEARKLGVGRTVGVDYVPSAGGVEMVRPDRIAQIPDASIDILRFSHALEHLPDPCRTLEQFFPKMKPGGLLHITQPNFPVLYADAEGYPVRDAEYPEHLHFFSALSLYRMVQGAGFKVIRVFSHHKEEENFQKLCYWIDFQHIEDQMDEAADLGEAVFHPLGNYPCYCGENSALYATAGLRKDSPEDRSEAPNPPPL